LKKKKSLNWNRLNRQVHYWGSAIIAIPILIVIVSGIVLQLKKDVTWIQPATARGVGATPELAFANILEIASTVPEAEISEWKDVDRLDVRPSKGVVKVRAENRWEIQIDTQTGDILQVEYRRSDLIESIHDGSFFHEYAKLWLFLPSAIILLVLWITGIYLFVIPYLSKLRKRRRVAAKNKVGADI